MKQPPYHLRSNKAVDRLTLVDVIKLTGRVADTRSYTYYGFGGPYLEDFRLLYEQLPEITLVSIERNDEVYKRQRFHIPCHSGQLRLKHIDFKSFLANYDSGGKKSIFWLDYQGLEFSHFDEFMSLLVRVAPGSIVKLTVGCDPADYVGKNDAERTELVNAFQSEFAELLPGASTEPPIEFAQMAKLVQEMVEVASQKALPGFWPTKFLPVASFYYADGAGMFTLTGVVWPRHDQARIRDVFRDWNFANLSWKTPRVIDLPILSTKERLHLQKRLPCPGSRPGKVLRRALGYLIDKSEHSTDAKLGQYAEFHRYFPYFVRAIP